jgi:hypothetical protein
MGAVTATADFMEGEDASFLSEDKQTSAMHNRPTDEARVMQRSVQRLMGASLMVAAVGLWVMPGSSWDTDLLLFKLALSLTGGLAGFGLLLASSTPRDPRVEIDTIRREVRVVRPAKGVGDIILRRCGFDDLARAEQDGPRVRMWDRNDDLLVDITMKNRDALFSLVGGLRDVGKLGQNAG